ncbi:MAG: hypothetical protein OHK0024_11800 [Thalassobaculales bacterium]
MQIPYFLAIVILALPAAALAQQPNEANAAARKIGCVAKNVYRLPDDAGNRRYVVTCSMDKPAAQASVACPANGGSCRAQPVRR